MLNCVRLKSILSLCNNSFNRTFLLQRTAGARTTRLQKLLVNQQIFACYHLSFNSFGGDVNITMPPKRGRPPKAKAAKKSEEKKAVAKKVTSKQTEQDEDESESESGSNSENEVELPAPKRTKTEKKTEEKPETKTFMNQTESNLDEINFECEKLNADGEKYNTKICIWNVSGIRALLKKNGMDYLEKEGADIIALQETKCETKKLPDEIKLKGYKNYFLDSKKSGYCGMALLSKKEPLNISYGLSDSEFDDEGRLITAEYDNFYLLNVYVPNAGNKLVTLPKRLKWNEAFKKYIQDLDKKKPVIVCGDMNVAHQEIDLTNPKTNTKNAGFTQEERDGMTDFLKAGFVDTFRLFYPDKTGAYTFWSYFRNARSKNIGWRLDYFIVSERIKNKVCDVVNRDQVFGSDHCPVVFYATL